MITVDIAIIGAGPTGLFAAYYAGFRGLSTVVADALPEPGGQITAMYPEKLIYDVGGFPQIKGRDLVSNLVEQAAPFRPRYLLGNRAELLRHVAQRPRLSFADGTEVDCGAVIITGGLGGFSSRPLPAAEAFGGEGLEYFVPRLEAHRDRDVVVVGGGDSAFDWAMALHPLARSVTLVHRRERFRAHEATVTRVRSLGVPILTNAQVTRLLGEQRVRGVELDIKGEEALTTLPADTVVAALGFVADLGPITEWGLSLDKRHILTDSTAATNLSRVFAAGDIAEYPGKVRLIATGFGEAATAVNNAAVAIDPQAKVFPGHSSDVK